MSGNPLISVLMPVYNAERYLAQAVESVLAQTLGDFEFIIINDGSTDRSEEILRGFAARDSRIRLISRPNTGYVVALNEGLGQACGEFIARMDADDVCLPRRFERQIAFLRQHPKVALVGGRVEIIDEAGRLIIRPRVPLDNDALQRALLEGKNLIGHPTVMVRRQTMLDCGGYNVDACPAEDLDMWLRVGEVGEVANVPELILKYRQHARSVSATQHDVQVRNTRLACERAWQRRGVQGALSPDVNSRPGQDRESQFDFQVRWGWWAFNSGQRLTSAVYAWRAIRLQPWREPGWKLLACAVLKKAPAAEATGEVVGQ